MNDNQNYFVSRSTSRVLNVPGGKCSIDIFGNDVDDIKSKHPANVSNVRSDVTTYPSLLDEVARNKQRATGDSFDLFDSSPCTDLKSSGSNGSTSTDFSRAAGRASQTDGLFKISSNQFASASSTNSYNVITDRPTSRVLQPPGGKCSDIFG